MEVDLAEYGAPTNRDFSRLDGTDTGITIGSTTYSINDGTDGGVGIGTRNTVFTIPPNDALFVVSKEVTSP